ncbi:MAG: type II toxin-antitoxin system VapC family toxin [Methanothrix sp.]|jgi:predicted nucleic acid-binding protein|nr:type II toxin-antitoxin system VapC family toxin [Methanothrix sp.]
MIVVVDVSVAIKWFIAEDNANDALELLGKKYELHAPDLLFLEVDNVLCKLIRRGLLSEDEGFDIHNKILSFPIRSYPSQNFREEAFHLAIETKSSVYDCLYLALAEALDGRMVTADGKFFQALGDSSMSDRMLWVEDLKRA